MARRHWSLAVVERESEVLPRMLDASAAGHARRWLATRNVAVHCSATVRRIRQQADGTKAVELSAGQSLAADIVILATGIRPNLDLVRGSGIATGEAKLLLGCDIVVAVSEDVISKTTAGRALPICGKL